MKSDFDNTHPCPNCGGIGEEEVEYYTLASFSNPYGDIYMEMKTCERCFGDGYIEKPDD